MGRLGIVLAVLTVLGFGTGLVRAQDVTGADEMILQADRLFEQGRFCQAAPRYRAVVGERPEAFLRYAQARAACLGRERDDSGSQEAPL